MTAATIAELAAALDVTHRTLRFYEQKELLAPAREGQTRLYDGEQVARARVILAARAAGFTVETIRQGLRSDQAAAWLDLPAEVLSRNTLAQIAAQVEADERRAAAQRIETEGLIMSAHYGWRAA